MKHYKSLRICAASVLIGLVSCTKQLDIQPRQEIDASVALSSTEDIQNVLTGGYTIIARGALYGTNLVLLPDVIANTDYLNWLGTFNSYRDLTRKTQIATNAEATRTWSAAYEAVNVANTILSASSVVSDQATKDAIDGQALMIRGMMHFELVRLYALPYEAGGANSSLGVPIVTTKVQNISDLTLSQPRNTVAEVYTAVEADLNSAIEKLDAGGSDFVYTAAAFLGRVYLQEGKYAEALEVANTIIDDGAYALLPGLETPFRTKNSSEGIFEIQQNEQSNAGTANDGLATFYSSYTTSSGGFYGRADALVNPTFAASYEAGDLRRSQLIYDGTGNRPGLFTKKWNDYFGNIPVCRITEQYLVRAECNARLGSAVGATPAADLNLIRNRAGLASIAAPTVAQILTEREHELAYEGFRLHDYKRTKRSIGTMPYNDPLLVLPIPNRETNVNPSLVQNPGY
ncbi:MAG: RagB/SusD family nutrient uptake outer membrane protein [Mucilaginibacter polytrichastri]|nr:RagB/SusD family nutrient uptake outer membrane protein [Mucilaginibacter polytrichastri]